MALATPLNFIAQQGNGEAYLSWNAVTNAATYVVLRSTDNVTFAQVADVAAVDYTDSSVVLQTQYYYYVQAKNGTDLSQATSVQSVIPVRTGDMSLGELRLLSQQRADRVNSNFISTPEWNSYINQSAAELYDLLVTTYEDYYLAEPYRFVTDGNASKYALPSDFYKLMGVDCALAANNNAWVSLNKFEFIERNKYVYPNNTGTILGVFNMQYRAMGANLQLIPTPSANQTLQVWYIPKLPIMLKDTDILDGISGWTEYVIVDAAIKALQKEESDTSLLMGQKQMLKQRIEETASNRDAGMPSTISNSRHGNGGWGYNGPTGGI